MCTDDCVDLCIETWRWGVSPIAERLLRATNTDIEELRLPVPWLDELAIVDTPGTNAVVVAHEQLTKRIVPRADLVLL